MAIAPADVPDIGADTGRFTLPITCQINVPLLNGFTVLNLNGSVDIQGIAPVQLAPGQPFYLSQGSGALTLPSWLSTLGGLVAVNRADATVTQLNIQATGSTPDTINVADLQPLVADNVPIVGGKPITVGLPKTGTFNIGPYKAPQSGVTQLKFVSAQAKVQLRSPWGLNLQVIANCKAAASAGGGASLLSISVGGAPNSSTVNFQNQPLNFHPAASNQLVGIVNAPYTCTIGGSPFNVGIAVSADIPLTVPKGGNLPFSNASGALIIPAATVDQFIAQGKTSIGGKVTSLTLRVQGGSPDNKNVIPAAGITIPTTPLVSGQKVIIPLPQTGTLSAGPFTPTSGSSAVVVGLGSAAGTLTFGGTTGSVSATCAQPSPDALLVDAAVV
ncbi:MAG: DUF6801 domain-containing protein [Solirubrobacteraceae bacterium]|nr:hypothetical protein [Patulibacter sp.]